ncbi:MAG TPA: hypothetical protein DEA96_17690 [Leptospiraceae bacterium]|nr:hypothetical protein [Spirochaetaceae bacterium]HBS06807.1 hypothetical protein [Leptospiraceae bacterium]|tara:strand:- start:28005 stop:28283 length:279 start_codon:yes stop_codon:yes gene_type:complete
MNQNSPEQIPAGFDAETWNKLTPEQKQTFLAGQQGQQPNAQQAQPQQQAYGNPQSMQDDMMKDIKKQTMFAMIFGMVGSLITSIVSMFIRRN